MFKSIVVGTDGSESASKAVLAAAELAATPARGRPPHRDRAEAALAHGHGRGGDGRRRAGRRRGAAGKTRSSASSSRPSGAPPTPPARAGEHRIETHARFGSPAEVLCDMAAHLSADLIVVGNRGMQGGRRFLGSVPNTVSHHAPCSVLIVDTID